MRFAVLALAGLIVAGSSAPTPGYAVTSATQLGSVQLTPPGR